MPQVTDPNILEQLNNPTTVQTLPPAQSGRSGGVIITDPTVAAEEERKRAAEARAAAAEARAAAEFAGEGGKPTEAQNKTSTLLTRIAGGFADINAVRETNPDAQAEGFGEALASGLFGEGMISRGIAGPDRRIVRDAQRDILDALLTLGTGAAYNAEQLEGQLVSYFPQYNDTPEEIEIKNNRLQRLIESAKVAAGPQWNEVEQAIGPLMPQAARPSPLETPSGEPRTEVSGTSETFLTPEDLEMQSRLNAAYQSGATLQELQAISAEYNRTFPIASQEALDAARNEGRAISVQPSGTRSAAGEVLGAVGETPVGAYFAGASNALLSGGMDELAPLLGLDPQTVQAAKEHLREQSPVASFAGEVTGGALQLAAGGAALRGAGMGARGLAAAEVAQGAAYGAGEANDNRLLGAAVGGGGALVGQQLAQRFLSPQVARIVDNIAAETGAPREAVEQTIADAVEGAAARTDNAPLPASAQEEFGQLAQTALGRGRSAQEAQERLAIMAQVDPEAKAAAERLGLVLPVDVLSNDARLLTATGLARSQISSDAQAAWGQTVSDTLQSVDNTLREIGASPNLAQVSADVRDRLQSQMGTLERQGAELRREVDNAINVRDRVEAENLQAVLAETINDLGGLAEAKKAFSPEEKRLLSMLGEGEAANRPTYARLNQIRDQIGRALFKNQGPWTDAPTAQLKRLYGALAEDQLAYVESVGGRELADKMRGSNDLFSKMYGVRDTMQSLYGKTLEGDISPLINRAITSAQKGDGKALRQVLKDVPEDMRAPALLSGMMAQSQRTSGQGGFSFSRYAKMYRGLRENSPFYKEIAQTVGPEAEQILRDLYSISRRMDAAENKIVRTGASNQPLINALNAQGLIGRTFEASKRIGARAGGAIAGGTMGGPVGASAGYEISAALESALTRGGKTRLEKLHDLIASEPFKELVERTATGDVSQSSINRVANSSQFRTFARFLGISTFEGRKNWLQSAMTVGAAQTAQPEQQPTSTIEVR